MTKNIYTSEQGLVSIGLVKGLPLINEYTSNPILCKSFMIELLEHWIDKASSVLEANNEPIPECSIEAMRIHLERWETEPNQKILCYRILHECKQALQLLEDCQKIPQAAYKTDKDTYERIGLPHHEELMPYQAAYHIFQAQYFLNIAQILGSEDIIMHGKKGVENLKNAREKSARNRNKDETYQEWQDWAQDVWQKKPSLSANRVAEIIKSKHGITQSVRTIRAKIQKAGNVY